MNNTTTPSSTVNKKRTLRETNGAMALRADMINGMFELPPETKAFMNKARETIERAAKELLDTDDTLALDVGRMIHVLDLLQQAKNCACDAAILGAEAKTRATKRTKTTE